MGLEAGIDSSIILHNEQLRQENEEMKYIINNFYQEKERQMTKKRENIISVRIRSLKNQTCGDFCDRIYNIALERAARIAEEEIERILNKEEE